MKVSSGTWVSLALLGASSLMGPAYGQPPETTGPSRADLAEEADRSERAREAARKEALAESIVAREERASGRPFDPLFRNEVRRGLAALPMDGLVTRTAREGLGPMDIGDSQADLVYTPVTPCRVFDTRLVGGPIVPGANRSFRVTGDTTPQGGADCGIPVGPATAAVLNLVAVTPAGEGDFRVTPFGTAVPLASVVNYGSVAGLGAIANGLVVTLCDPAAATCTADVTVQADVSASHLLADVQGYFRKLRKVQVKSTHAVARSTWEVGLDSSCTLYTDTSVTVTTPVAGRIVLRANVNVHLVHTTGTTSRVDVSLSKANDSCNPQWGFDEYAYMSSSAPTGHYYVWLHPSGEFPVGAGNHTYSVYGKIPGSGGSGHLFDWGALEATFIPD